MAMTKVIPSTNADATARYPLTEKDNQEDMGERVLSSFSYGCSPENAGAAFRQVREMYGKPGYIREIQDENGQKTGETEAIEALHVIISHDNLDPNNVDDIEKATTIAQRLAARQFPGYQYMGATQADGIGKKLHTHLVINTVAFEEAELDYNVEKDGKIIARKSVRHPGRLMGGRVTDIEAIRKTTDAIMREVGVEQTLETYEKDKPVERSVNDADYWAQQRGGKSNRDVCRDLIDGFITEGTTLEDLPKKMAEEGWEMEFTTRKSKGVTRPLVKFKKEDMKQSLIADDSSRKSNLGLDYTQEGLIRRIAEREREREELEREKAQQSTQHTSGIPTFEQAQAYMQGMDAYFDDIFVGLGDANSEEAQAKAAKLEKDIARDRALLVGPPVPVTQEEEFSPELEEEAARLLAQPASQGNSTASQPSEPPQEASQASSPSSVLSKTDLEEEERQEDEEERQEVQQSVELAQQEKVSEPAPSFSRLDSKMADLEAGLKKSGHSGREDDRPSKTD